MFNTKVIKKYKKEFEHYLNGGSICYLDTDNDKWYSYNEKTTSKQPSFNANGIYIISDNKVEFRKAIAEDKKVQCCGILPEEIGAKHMDRCDWYNVTDVDDVEMGPEYYRIKPRNFKVDDVVYCINKNCQWEYGKKYHVFDTLNGLHLTGTHPVHHNCDPHDFFDFEMPKEAFKEGDWVINPFFKGDETPFRFEEHQRDNSRTWMKYTSKWKPKSGEWCWFWNQERVPILGRFSTVSSFRSDLPDETYGIYESVVCRYRHIEPFIGNLPTHLKEKDE